MTGAMKTVTIRNKQSTQTYSCGLFMRDPANPQARDLASGFGLLIFGVRICPSLSTHPLKFGSTVKMMRRSCSPLVVLLVSVRFSSISPCALSIEKVRGLDGVAIRMEGSWLVSWLAASKQETNAAAKVAMRTMRNILQPLRDNPAIQDQKDNGL